MQIAIHRDRATQVLDTLYAYYKAGRFPYNIPEGQIPQLPENLPPNGFASPLEHARFLFVLCLYMRGKIKSHTATRAFSRLYVQYPEIFHPGTAQQLSHPWLQQTLKEFGLGFSCKQNARFWIENMHRLHKYWDGDPRNLFAGTTSYEQLAGRICNTKTRRKRYADREHLGFLGFQLKMTSMLIYFLLEAQLTAPLPFPVPVDFHVMRILIAHEATIVRGGNGNHKIERLQDAIREFSTWYCQTRGVGEVHMSEFIWCFSRASCARHPGNTSTYIGPRNSRGIVIAKPITWSRGQRRAYRLSCGQCPVEATCKHCIPAAPYYNHGQLIIRDRRDTPPQSWLFRPVREVLPEKKRKKAEPKEQQAPSPDNQLALKFS